NLGMARFAAHGSSASVVNVGAFLGYRPWDFMQLEVGASVFSYFLVDGSVKVKIPLMERYVALFAGMGVGSVLAVVTQNRGFNSAFVELGEMMPTPVLAFEVPLLGASIRGEMRFYVGSTTIFMGTYGVSYSL